MSIAEELVLLVAVFSAEQLRLSLDGSSEAVGGPATISNDREPRLGVHRSRCRVRTKTLTAEVAGGRPRSHDCVYSASKSSAEQKDIKQVCCQTSYILY